MSNRQSARPQRGTRPQQRGGQRPRKGNASRIVWIAGIAFIALIVGIGVALSGSGGRNDFEIVAYQGASELGGERVTFDQVLASGRPVVLNFWGGSCPPCRAEMPGFERVYRQFSDQFLMVGLDVGPFLNLGTRRSATALLQELDITYPAAYATSIDALRAYGLNGLPATFFIAPDGRIVDRSLGFINEAEFQSKLAALLAQSVASAPSNQSSG